MNKFDIYAYKHNDNNQYCLVPGFNTYKAEPKEQMLVKKVKVYDKMDRLKKSGFSRDVRDVSLNIFYLKTHIFL